MLLVQWCATMGALPTVVAQQVVPVGTLPTHDQLNKPYHVSAALTTAQQGGMVYLFLFLAAGTAATVPLAHD